MNRIFRLLPPLIALLAPLLTLAGCGNQAATTNADKFFREGKLRALVISGRNNHDWRTTSPHLQALLERTGRFDTRLCEEPAGLDAAALAPYDLLVLDYCGPRWGKQAEAAVEEFVRRGGGLLVVHGAVYGFGEMELLGDGHVRTGIREQPWTEFRKMAGGWWTDQEPASGHGSRHSFAVRCTDRDHPVTAGLGEQLIASDELYHRLRLEPGTRVLAVAFSDTATGGTGQDEAMLWCRDYGQGKVFYTALGHDLVAMSEPGFIASFVRGAEWAASGAVSLPEGAGLEVRDPAALRLLVVTGGHDYQSDFYSVFDQPGLAWDHLPSAAEAFSRDLRQDYDVLVLYDLTRELDEAQQANLRAFVEGGKGLVVLHHAVADYTRWPWWYGEVVGGKYLLEPDLGLPASTYQHDVELTVRKVADHPITRDLSPLHLVDETYKGMWISDSVTVLLATDHPTSDGPVAWVSPYPQSRVVVVQLGHDRQALRHPGYRELVRRSALWAGGKL